MTCQGRTRLTTAARAGVVATLLGVAAVTQSASASVLSMTRVSEPTPFPIGECRPDDEAINDPEGQRDWGNEEQPTIAVDPTDPRKIVTAYVSDGYGVVASSSHDGGETWVRTVVPGLTKCTGGTLNHPAWPRLAFGPEGRLYLAVSAITSHFPTPGAFVSSVGVITSTDAGRTWDEPVWITDLPLAARSHLISAEPDNPGSAVVTWHSPQPLTRSFISRTTDGGRTWATHQLPVPPHRFQPFSTPVAASGGRLYVLYTTQPAPTAVKQVNAGAGSPLDLSSEIFVTVSDDGGTTWTQPVSILDGAIPDWIGAEIAPDGSIYVSTWRGTDPSRELVLLRSDDRGATWSAPSLIASDAVAPSPGLAISADGALGVTYLRATAGDQREVVFARSADRGLTWTQEVVAGPYAPLTAADTAYQETASRGTDFAAVFIGTGPDTDGPSDVYVAQLR